MATKKTGEKLALQQLVANEKKYWQYMSDDARKVVSDAEEELEVFKGAKELIDQLNRELQALGEALKLHAGELEGVIVPIDKARNLLEKSETAYRLWKRNFPNDITLEPFIEIARSVLLPILVSSDAGSTGQETREENQND